MENDCEYIYCSITSEDAILESKHRNKLHCVGWVIFIYSITSNNVMVKFEVMPYLNFNPLKGISRRGWSCIIITLVCTCTDGCNQAFSAILILQHLLHSRRLQDSMETRCTVSHLQAMCLHSVYADYGIII